VDRYRPSPADGAAAAGSLNRDADSSARNERSLADHRLASIEMQTTDTLALPDGQNLRPADLHIAAVGDLDSRTTGIPHHQILQDNRASVADRHRRRGRQPLIPATVDPSRT